MFLFKSFSLCFHRLGCRTGKFHALYYLAVVLKEFYSVPSLLLFWNRTRKNALNFCYSTFQLFWEDIFRKIDFWLLSNFYCFIDQFVKSFTFQRRCLDNRTVKQHWKSLHINLDSSLRKKICHVQCNNNRNACLDQLSCQIQVTFNIGCIHQINDHIRIFFQHIVTADDLFQCIWRHWIDTRKVSYDNFFLCLLTF